MLMLSIHDIRSKKYGWEDTEADMFLKVVGLLTFTAYVDFNAIMIL